MSVLSARKDEAAGTSVEVDSEMENGNVLSAKTQDSDAQYSESNVYI